MAHRLEIGLRMVDRGSGRLYVVATPIGNLADLAPRAVEILKSVPIVACEDTRRSRLLLAHVGAAPARLVALHDHNEAAASRRVVAKLCAGDDVALICDAGTPLVSDPGFELLRQAWRAGVPVTPLPGPSAVTAALSVSPIAVQRFRFEGFLPAKAAARRRTLQRALAADVAVVFFEAPHRLRDTLADLEALGGGTRQLLVCRELTKRFETLSFATVAELRSTDAVLDRGEFVCILSSAPQPPPESARASAVVEALAAELPAGQAARLAAKITGQPRARLYRQALALRDDTRLSKRCAEE